MSHVVKVETEEVGSVKAEPMEEAETAPATEEDATAVPLTELLADNWESSQDSRYGDSEEMSTQAPERAMEDERTNDEFPQSDAEEDQAEEASQMASEDAGEAAKQLMESLVSSLSPREPDRTTEESVSDFAKTTAQSDSILYSPPPPPPRAGEEENSVSQDASVLAAMVQQTPTVITSIDGNVELAVQSNAPVVPPGGVKIKINLFNKVAASSPAPVLPPASPPDVSTSASATHSPPRTSSTTEGERDGIPPEPVPPPPDDAALTNKPRLIGRKLTVLPLMTKGVETSGLCSIM